MDTSMHVTMTFGPGIPQDQRGPLMMAWEKLARERGIRAELFLDRMADDSKLRRSMTTEQRAKL